jgi:archaemetzincin
VRRLGQLPLLLLGALACGGEPVDPRLAFATGDAGGFEKLGPPAPRSWRARFRERPQGFDAYVESDPVRAQPGEVLALLPVGPFSERERAVLDRTAEFAAIWFGLPVRTLDAAGLPEKGWHRERTWGRQYETGWFLRRLLPERRPREAVSTFAVTMADLYPDDDWNYVFGEASLRDRVGVWSFARYFPRFWGQEETADSDRQALRRALQVVVHEMGHAFGIEHCQVYACTMNGSNSLEESDSQPLRLCPPCLKKLQWNRGFDVVARYGKLRDFYRVNGLLPEAEWIEKRLEAINAAKQARRRGRRRGSGGAGGRPCCRCAR